MANIYYKKSDQMNLSQSIFSANNPIVDMEDVSDQDILNQLKSEFAKGWNVNTIYKLDDCSYNMLYACAKNKKINTCLWLIEFGADVNFITKYKNDTSFGIKNSSALFCYLDQLTNTQLDTDNFLKFANKLKQCGANLSLLLDDSKIYTKYDVYDFNGSLSSSVIDFLIENYDFKNGFLFSVILEKNEYFNFKVLKKAVLNTTLDLNRFKPANDENSSMSYWDQIASSCNSKEKFVLIEWLHNKLGFNLNQKHKHITFENVVKSPGKIYKKITEVNLLGLAMMHNNKPMFDWILKKNSVLIDDEFIVNSVDYSLLEFGLLCKFTPAIQLGLQKMPKNELLSLNLEKIKDLCEVRDKNIIKTLESTYRSLLFKELSDKYPKKSDSLRFVKEKI